MSTTEEPTVTAQDEEQPENQGLTSEIHVLEIMCTSRWTFRNLITFTLLRSRDHRQLSICMHLEICKQSFCFLW